MQPPDTAKLVVRRTTSNWMDQRSRYKLFVDDEHVADLRSGETIERPVEPGRRVLQVRYGWVRSRRLEVALRAGGQVTLVVDPLGAFAGLVVLVWPRAFFRLSLED